MSAYVRAELQIEACIGHRCVLAFSFATPSWTLKACIHCAVSWRILGIPFGTTASWSPNECFERVVLLGLYAFSYFFCWKDALGGMDKALEGLNRTHRADQWTPVCWDSLSR